MQTEAGTGPASFSYASFGASINAKRMCSPFCPSNWAGQLASGRRLGPPPRPQWRALSWCVQRWPWSCWGSHGGPSQLCHWCGTRCPGRPPGVPGWGSGRSTWCASRGTPCDAEGIERKRHYEVKIKLISTVPRVSIYTLSFTSGKYKFGHVLW